MRARSFMVCGFQKASYRAHTYVIYIIYQDLKL
jgi:hypothetical protein